MSARTETCRAVLSDGAGRVWSDTIEVGPPGPGDLRVRLMASGLCHTDWDFARRRPPVHVMGHEGAGTVESVGDGVTGFAAGDRVVLNWAMPCGRCRLCTLGHQNICDHKPTVAPETIRHRGEPVGRSFALGTLAELTVVPAAAATRIEVGIPWTSACILGCGVMTGFGSVVNTARVEPGGSVVVVGAGGVGLNCVQGARIAGASRVVAVDVAETKLGWARDFGATETVLAARGDSGLRRAAADIVERTGGGADYAFECTGVPALAFAPLAMVRHGGTAVQVSGVDESFEADGLLLKWDKVYIQPKYGGCRPAIDFPRMLRLYADGELRLDELVTRVYGLDEVEAAFGDMLAGRLAKGVVRLAG